MSQAKIRNERKRIEEEIKQIEKKLKITEAQLEALQDECEHPVLRKYSALGEIGYKCDDCGYQS